MIRSRLHWQIYVQMLLQFHVMQEMMINSFNYLLEILPPNEQLEEPFTGMCCGSPLTCNIMLNCAIHFLQVDLTMTIGKQQVYQSLLYCVVQHSIFTINHCMALEITLPSDCDEIISISQGFWQKSTRDSALDGFLVRIKAPLQEKCGGTLSAYYSGHYCCYGLNVQVICNSINCCFFSLQLLPQGK